MEKPRWLREATVDLLTDIKTKVDLSDEIVSKVLENVYIEAYAQGVLDTREWHAHIADWSVSDHDNVR